MAGRRIHPFLRWRFSECNGCCPDDREQHAERKRDSAQPPETIKLHLSSQLPLVSKLTLPIPRLSKAGMPARSEGWGGLFKDEQYRLIKERSAGICKVAARL